MKFLCNCIGLLLIFCNLLNIHIFCDIWSTQFAFYIAAYIHAHTRGLWKNTQWDELWTVIQCNCNYSGNNLFFVKQIRCVSANLCVTAWFYCLYFFNYWIFITFLAFGALGMNFIVLSTLRKRQSRILNVRRTVNYTPMQM